jgi:Cysteine-rich secretory protein family
MTKLFPGQQLLPEQSLQSSNQLHTLILQQDGNAVLYDRNSKPLWSTNTGGLITPREFTMQDDGNLVLYSTDGTPHWASNTYGNPGAFFDIQDDGNLVVYRAGSQTETPDNALWAAGSNDPWNLGPRDQVQEILDAHNNYRIAVGVPVLQWADGLAVDAQQYAEYLAELRQLVHSGNPDVGENLAGGTGTYTATQLVDLWGNEKQYFVGGIFPNVSSTGNWMDVGHYAQLVWRNTTQVGCGLTTINGYTVMVGRYSPPGNVLGESVY